MSGARASALSAPAFLTIWEQGAACHPIDRALLILRCACPGRTLQELQGLTIGERDSMLLEARLRTFGNDLSGYAECPACSERHEFSVSCEALLHGVESPATPQSFVHEGKEWRVRAPTSADLAAVVTAPSTRAAAQALLARCATSTSEVSTNLEALEKKLIAALAAADPGAEIQISLNCQACRHSWLGLLDVAQFFWTEIRTHARRLLQEIDVLAHRYGWSESEILRMSDRRRELYVQMALA